MRGENGSKRLVVCLSEYLPLPSVGLYTEYAGLAVTADIGVKFGTAHGRLRPEDGSGFPIEAYGSRGVSQPSLVFGKMAKLSMYMSNLQKVRMDYSSHGIYTCNHVGFSLFPLLSSWNKPGTASKLSTF